MEWDNDFTLKFIKLYQSEPIIWDPNHSQYKNKVKVHKAWARLATTLRKPVQELKAKKNSLMATFRGHWRKKQISKRTAEDDYEVHKPIWFAYDSLEKFLAPMYNSKGGNKAFEEDYYGHLPNKMCMEENDPLDSIDQIGIASSPLKVKELVQKHDTRKTIGVPNANWRLKARHPANNDVADIQKKIKQTLFTLNNYISEKTTEDDCDLYGKLVATKLRKYSEQERQQMMYEIDGLLLTKPPKPALPNSPFNCSGPPSPEEFKESQCCTDISPTQFCILDET